MATPGLSKSALALVPKVIAAYDGGGSYNTVGQKFKLKTCTVQAIMRQFSPGSIRTSHDQQSRVRINPKPAAEGMTLAALGLFKVGPCWECRVEMVSVTPEKDQTCGLCEDFAGRAA